MSAVFTACCIVFETCGGGLVSDFSASVGNIAKFPSLMIIHLYSLAVAAPVLSLHTHARTHGRREMYVQTYDQLPNLGGPGPH